MSTGTAFPTVVEVGNATVDVGGSGSVDIWVRNFPDDGYGLGCYTITVGYDPTMIEVTAVSPGAPPFDAPISNIYADYVSITQFSTQMPGPAGDIRICDLEFTCLAEGETTMVLTIETLANTNGDDIPAVPIHGTIIQLPVVAETSIAEEQDWDEAAVIQGNITRVKDSTTGETISGIPIAAYEARALYNPAGIRMLTVRPGDAPFDNPDFIIDNPSGVTSFWQSTVAGSEPPVSVARLVPRLIGCALDNYDLEVTFDRIADPDGNEIPQEAPQSLTFQRGDITGDGVVNIIDAMFGAQYLVGLRPVEDIRQLNMASVRHDDSGDIKSIIDCMFIAQYVVGIRDCYFELVPAREIKIGVIGPMAYLQGEHHWYGAQLAAEDINTRGGILVGGEPYRVTLVQVDSNELLSVADAVSAMERAITVDNADFVVGGFRSEAVLAMQDVAMDYETIFLGCGASVDELCERVATDYNTYKYWFRITPVNGTNLATISFMLTGMVAQEVGALTYPDAPKVAILAENMAWADPLVATAEAYFAAAPPNGMGLTVVGTWRPSQTATDVAVYLGEIEAAGANMIYTVVSGPLGVAYTSQWGQLEIPAASVGINVEAQKGNFMDVTGGYGAYETTLNTYARVAITDETIPFYDTFVERFGQIPIYTAGTYDAINILKDAIKRASTLDTDAVVTALEGTDTPGSLGRLVFMGTDTATPHDVTWGPGYVTGLGVQWQGGELECVWPDAGGVLAPVFYEGTADYVVPPWVVETWGP
ncbi:MAG: ABC transporter substrate-binding protein [Desulfobacterales bacterium]|nr:ABC transporter substrate-binding protein [Desulfobacterales bacterium]